MNNQNALYSYIETLVLVDRGRPEENLVLSQKMLFKDLIWILLASTPRHWSVEAGSTNAFSTTAADPSRVGQTCEVHDCFLGCRADQSHLVQGWQGAQEHVQASCMIFSKRFRMKIIFRSRPPRVLQLSASLALRTTTLVSTWWSSRMSPESSNRWPISPSLSQPTKERCVFKRNLWDIFESLIPGPRLLHSTQRLASPTECSGRVRLQDFWRTQAGHPVVQGANKFNRSKL